MMALMAVAMLGGCAFFRRFWSRGLALGLLLVVAMVAWRLPKLGSEFMPPLDEGSILDMPVTTPRVSAAQAADDLKARDEVLRSLPEVELAVGKAGRADTPTDPSGLDMVETVITLRPSEYWPKRKVRYEDAAAEASLLAGRLKEAGILRPQLAGAALDNLVGAATMEAVADFDRAMRELARRRQIEHDAALSAELTAASVDDLLALLADKRRLSRQPTTDQRDRLVAELAAAHGELLVTTPRQEEMNLLLTAAAAKLAALGVTDSSPDLLLAAPSAWRTVRDTAASLLGRPTSSVFAEFFERFSRRLHEARIARARMLNWELQDQAPGTLDWLLLSSLREHARRLGELARPADDAELAAMRQRRAGELAGSLQLWPKSKNDLIKELDTELQVPGWGNIWTQPIINRVDMLATGVRTQIGVKVFGPRMEDLTIQQDGGAVVTQKGIQTIANEVAAALKNVPGAVDVFPDQVVGRSYLMVEVNRDKAARYGVNVGDVQQAIEVAMGGKAVTTTVENRQRFAVRVRYARDFWQTEAALRETLVAGRRGESTLLTPISEVADIRRAEGPSVIKSENGQLRAYVQLNVRDRDVMGFVEEAQRVVAQGVALPDGFHIEWGGQFEHQVRARQTLWVIFPVVIALIFVILLVTFNSWRDALLIVLAVPGALAGGIIFQSIFGFNFSVAVWVGFIACFGMATQTGIVMLVYLHDAIRARGGLAAIATRGELTDTIVAGAVHRLRPKLMTEGVAIIGLMPMLWASGVGAEVIKPMAAPVLGGLLVADEVIDLLIPVVFNWYMGRRWAKAHGQPVAGGAGSREPVAGQPGARSR
jgi:Cu(I)/Ag(I) efflux system membrane protein CusA/SilA